MQGSFLYLLVSLTIMALVIDPIYNHITLEEDILPLIDNPYFQRLRGVKQNSLLFYVYPSAKHDRFSHSIGTYHLMRQVVENGMMNLTDKDAFNLKAAALLHDIGHGPYSHLWERLIPEYDHEKMSEKIITEVFGLPEVAKIIAKDHPLSELLSSVVDVDKLDYMSRDSYFCGVGYGRTDTSRIVNYLHVDQGKLCVPLKVITSLEHVITGRISLYKSTYFHHRIRAMDANLLAIMRRVRDLFDSGKEVFTDTIMRKALQGTIGIKDFLYCDDAFLEYHLNAWKHSKDEILSDLIHRFFSRKGFKAVSKKYFKNPLSSHSFDERYYVHHDNIQKSVYESEIYLKKNEKLIPLTQASSYIQAVANISINEEYIIVPRELIESPFQE